MRNLKKVLSLVLCVAMMLSVMVMSTGATSFSDEDEFSPQYKEAAEVLTGMGVIQGYEDGSYFLPQRNITRAQVATMIYRAVTHDVNDTQTGIYKDYNKFKDVPSTDWSAGYVNYCANGEIIKGFTPDTFGPLKNVTGYQVLAMILRAVGYDANDEFTGDGWAIRVATTAQQLGILENVQEATLGEPATRELVAELIFQTMTKVDMVDYTPAFGYQPTWPRETLGEDEFGLWLENDTADVWGRPGDTWHYDTGDKSTIIEETPVATYTAAVTECQIAEDAGFDGVETYTLYTNGVVNDTQYKVQATDTVQKIGGQGTLTEVYEDEIVTIDTFLAVVTDVKDATFDKAGHLKDHATITLTVYDKETGTSNYTLTKTDATNYEYEKDDYVLINAYTKNTPEKGTGSVTVDNVVTETTKDATKYGEILGVAEAMTGAQTYIWRNASRHTVNGTEYNDAKWFELDQAGESTANHTWFFDKYDNLIGVVDIATQYSYGIIENIQWQNPSMATGYALATIRYMDNTTDQMTVTAIDGNKLTYNTTGNNPVADFSNGVISTSMAENADFCGQDLYRIYTAADGSVSLEQVFTDADNNDSNNINGTVSINELNELTHATIRTGRATISGDGSGTSPDSINVNSDTTFLVRNDAPTGATYTVVDGYNNITNYTTGDKAHVDYVDLDGDKYADYVYVTGTPDNAKTSGLIYLTSDEVKAVTVDDKITHYELTGYIDGVPGTIYVDNDKDGNDNLIDLLVPDDGTSYVNRLFAVDFTDGMVTNVCNTNKPLSDALTNVDNIFVNKGTDYEDLSLTKWYDGKTADAANLDGTVLTVNNQLFNVSDAVVIGEDLLVEGDLSDKEIYVIYDPANPVNNAYVAEYVYIAEPAEEGGNSGDTTVTYEVQPTAGKEITVTLANNKVKLENAKVVVLKNGEEDNFSFGTADLSITITEVSSGKVAFKQTVTVTGTGTDNCVINTEVPQTLTSGNYLVTMTISNDDIGTLNVVENYSAGI